MCGIFGSIGLIPSEKNIRIIDNHLKERGPDNFGKWISDSKKIFFYHRRLSIIDLSADAAQPMVMKNLGIIINYNGEIYNFRELKKELEEIGYKFTTNSDTEVIGISYYHWKEKCLDKLKGMFAFCIYDLEKNLFFFARDPIGQKPLYYSIDKNNLYYSSNLNIFINTNLVKKVIDLKSLKYNLSIGYIPAPFTIYKNIKSLKPGNYAIFHNNKFTETPYFSPPAKILTSQKSEKNLIEDFYNLSKQVFNEHLSSDVDIGMLLSGGIDSTYIAEILKNNTKKNIGFYHLEQKNQDNKFIEEVSEKLNSKIIKIKPNENQVLNLLKDTVKISYQPQGYSSLISQNLISREISKYVKVAISGDGADEIFGGYSWYYLKKNLSIFFKFKTIFYEGYDEFLEFSKKGSIFSHISKLYPRFLPNELNKLFYNIPSNDFNMDDLADPFKQYYFTELPETQRFQILDLMTFCSNHICSKVDEMSMAHGLEIRNPFLDTRIIEWSFNNYKKSFEKKNILKKILRNTYSQNFIDRKKIGFSFKLIENLNLEKVKKNIIASEFATLYCDLNEIKKIFKKKHPFYTARLLALNNLVEWYRVH